MKTIIIAVCIVCMTSGVARALNFSEDFSNPVVAAARFSYDGPGDTSRFAFAAGKMTAGYDSLADPVRGYIPLGETLTEADSFKFGAVVTILSENFEASYFGNFQISFGLVNVGGNALNKTGLARSVPYGEAADIYNNLEINYFPNEFYGFGPNYGPTLFGPAANGGDDAFLNFQSPTAGQFQLMDQENEEDIPKDVLLDMYAEFDADTGLMTYWCKRWTGSEWVGLVLYEDPDTNVTYTEVTFDPFLYRSDWNPGINGFNVDAFGISLYRDPFDDDALSDGLQSLLADVEFHEIYCLDDAGQIPEPATIVAALLGGLALATRVRRKK